MMVLFWLLLLGFIAGAWWLLSRDRYDPSYRTIWLVAVIVLTLWWGSALISAASVGSENTGAGWDKAGTGVVVLFSIPALILDILVLLRWPKKPDW